VRRRDDVGTIRDRRINDDCDLNVGRDDFRDRRIGENGRNGTT
jgi:hypothetical protein